MTGTEGSWQAGKNHAKPGVYMPAHPSVGQVGLQEFYAGHAQERFQVLKSHRQGCCARGLLECRPGHQGMDSARTGCRRQQDLRARTVLVEKTLKGQEEALRLGLGHSAWLTSRRLPAPLPVPCVRRSLGTDCCAGR